MQPCVQPPDIGRRQRLASPNYQIEYFEANEHLREWIEVPVIVSQVPTVAPLFCRSSLLMCNHFRDAANAGIARI